MPESVKALKDIPLGPLTYGASVGTATGGVAGSVTSWVFVANKDRLQLICGMISGIAGAIIGGTVGFMAMRTWIMRNGPDAIKAVGKMHSGTLVGAIGGATAGGSSGATAGYTVAGLIYDAFKKHKEQ